MGRPEQSFEEFVEEKNRKVQTAGLLQTFGKQGDQEPPEDISITLMKKIQRSLLRGIKDLDLDVDNNEALKLGDVLQADLEKLFPQEAKPEKAVSMFDLITLGHVKDEDTEKFIQRHRLDLDKPDDVEYILQLFTEAIEFFDKYIVAGTQKLKINKSLRKFKTKEDVFNIFKVASGITNFKQLIPQACALLRIAGAIDYMRRDSKIPLLPEAWEEMERTAKKHISEPEKIGGGKVRHLKVEQDLPILFTFERRTKDPEQVIAKLLHRPENRTKEVLDHIGWRFIVNNAANTLTLIYKIFFDKKTAIFPYTNISIGETKNSMLDESKLMEAINDPDKADKLFNELSQEIRDEELIVSGDVKDGQNPNSLKGYRAIHVTFRLPLNLKDGRRESFPIEIQFVDRKSKTHTDKHAPHGEYKDKQREEVIKRVTGNNLLTAYEALSEENE